MTIEMTVLGHPKGQPRARAFAFKGATGKYSARMYDPGTAEAWKGAIALVAKEFIPPTAPESAVRLEITFLMPRPKRLLTKKSPTARIPHTAKPDADNAAKCVMDALTVLGFWRDDAQVMSLDINKYYAAVDEPAGAEIRITYDYNG